MIGLGGTPGSVGPRKKGSAEVRVQRFHSLRSSVVAEADLFLTVAAANHGTTVTATRMHTPTGAR